MPAPHVQRQAVGLTRPHPARLVLMEGCGIREDRFNKGPRCFHGIFSDEQHRVAAQGIGWKTLIGINFFRSVLVDCR